AAADVRGDRRFGVFDQNAAAAVEAELGADRECQTVEGRAALLFRDLDDDRRGLAAAGPGASKRGANAGRRPGAAKRPFHGKILAKTYDNLRVIGITRAV